MFVTKLLLCVVAVLCAGLFAAMAGGILTSLNNVKDAEAKSVELNPSQLALQGPAALSAPALVPDGAAPSDLRFTEDGDDLVVRLTIEGPGARQVVLTDYTIDGGMPGWDEPPIGVNKSRRGPPQISLRYLVLINQGLPGFQNGGLMTPPTPSELRQQDRQDVAWRLTGFRKWGFRSEDAKIHVSRTMFAVPSDRLKEAVPKIQMTVDEADRLRKGMKAP